MPYREPDHVGYRNRTTSAEAMPSPSRVQGYRRVVLECVQQQPAHCDEIARRTNLSPFTVRPRLTELAHLGLIEQAGKGRLNSGKRGIIWKAAPSQLALFQ